MGVVISLRVWLECIDVVSVCCCKEVNRFPHIILISNPLVLVLFLQHHPYFLFIFIVFFVLVCNFCAIIIANVTQKNIRDRSKIEIARTWRYNYYR